MPVFPDPFGLASWGRRQAPGNPNPADYTSARGVDDSASVRPMHVESPTLGDDGGRGDGGAHERGDGDVPSPGRTRVGNWGMEPQGLGEPPRLPAIPADADGAADVAEDADPGTGVTGMEIVPVRTTDGGAAVPTADSGIGAFRWRIPGFSKILEKKLYSDNFSAGGHSWRILIFPKGNQMSMEQAQLDQLSLYLDVADSQALPQNWSRSARFTLSVINQRDPDRSVKKDTSHNFNSRENDWGFTQFMPLTEVYDLEKGFLVDDILEVEAVVNVRPYDSDANFWSYDSKKETGMVGLKNQGATCYMNSLLQTLYHLPYFRKAVYYMPTADTEDQSSSIPLALQGLFYKLQTQDQSVGTKELTKSFGWDAYDSFMQHDVQELNRVLCEKLEDKMKKTVVEGTIELLFEGHILSYIQCINVNYKSTRKESFYDLQLDVKGCKNVYDSFDKYVEVERLEGDNKYHAEQYGLQDAKKGVLFLDFPPVLQLQLKRFEYDFMRDTMVKINDYYEFPEVLDLDRDHGKYLAKLSPVEEEALDKQQQQQTGNQGGKQEQGQGQGEGERRLQFARKKKDVRNLYSLHSVLVHSGGVHGGHYYAYIRPDCKGQWYKFDDERVTKEDSKRAVDEQFGGEEEIPRANTGVNAPAPYRYTRYSNAYMLVYVRDCDRDSTLCKVNENDVPGHLQARLKSEMEEKERKRKEKAEAHLYTYVKIARDEDIKAQIGQSSFFELVDWESENIKTFRVSKASKVAALKEEVEKELGIPASQQSFWLWSKRENGTYRPSRHLQLEEENNFTLAKLKDAHAKTPATELKLYLETPSTVPGTPAMALPAKAKDSKLLFLKFYDPYAEKLSFVGHLYIDVEDKPHDYTEELCALAGLPTDAELTLYEEVRIEPQLVCDHVDPGLTFSSLQIGDGDIICFQKTLPQEMAEGAGTGAGMLTEGADAEKRETDAAVPSVTGSRAHGGPRFRDVPAFYNHIKNRQMVHFRRLDNPRENEFTLELSKQHTYDDVVERVADHVSSMNRQKRAREQEEGLQAQNEGEKSRTGGAQGMDVDREGLTSAEGPEHDISIDPARIRLSAHNSFLNQPKVPPFKYRGVDRLSDMLLHYNQATDTLYYEVLDIPLPELQRLKTLSINFHNFKGEQVSQHTLRLPKTATIGDVIKELRPKVKKDLSSPTAEIRMLQIFMHRIFKVYPETEPIENLNDTYWILRAEEVPAEESGHGLDLSAPDCLVPVYHVHGPGKKEAAAATGVTNGEAAKPPVGQETEIDDAMDLEPRKVQEQSHGPQGQLSFFGDPLLVLVKGTDTVADVLSRIQTKLDAPVADFNLWRLAVVTSSSGAALHYVDDLHARVRSVFQKVETAPFSADPSVPVLALGLEHPDTAPRRPAAGLNTGVQSRYGFEKPVRILN